MPNCLVSCVSCPHRLPRSSGKAWLLPIDLKSLWGSAGSRGLAPALSSACAPPCRPWWQGACWLLPCIVRRGSSQARFMTLVSSGLCSGRCPVAPTIAAVRALGHSGRFVVCVCVLNDKLLLGAAGPGIAQCELGTANSYSCHQLGMLYRLYEAGRYGQ